MWARALLFRRFTDTNVYGTGSVKIRKTRHKFPVLWIYGYFYSVYIVVGWEMTDHRARLLSIIRPRRLCIERIGGLLVFQTLCVLVFLSVCLSV